MKQRTSKRQWPATKHFGETIVALNGVGYRGSLPVRWEAGRKDRFHRAPESCALVRKLGFDSTAAAFGLGFAGRA